eukprot:566928-Alexandrium_andersonii.AAC.1
MIAHATQIAREGMTRCADGSADASDAPAGDAECEDGGKRSWKGYATAQWKYIAENFPGKFSSFREYKR